MKIINALAFVLTALFATHVQAQERISVPLDVLEIKIWDCASSKWGSGFAIGASDCTGQYAGKSIQEFVQGLLIAGLYPAYDAVKLERSSVHHKKREWTIYFVHLKKKVE